MPHVGHEVAGKHPIQSVEIGVDCHCKLMLGYPVQPGGLLPDNVAQHVQGNSPGLLSVRAPQPYSQAVTHQSVMGLLGNIR